MNGHEPSKPGSPGASRPRGWIARLKTSLPTREMLASHPWLKPVAHRVLDPQLWTLRNEAVARGVAIGIFWAFAIPLAQFLATTAHCVWWRGNIPVAAGTTLITNPFTFGFWLWAAYKLGSFLLNAPPTVPFAENGGLLVWLTSYGAPAVLGMAIFAVCGACAGYMAVKLAGRVRICFRRRNR